MINSAKLKAKIVEKGLTIQKVAKAMNTSNYTLGQKISNNKTMSLEEATKLINLLDIPAKEVENIFFS